MKLLSVISLTTAMLVIRAQSQIYETNNVVVQTFAGSAFGGYLDGVGQQTMFGSPSRIVADSTGNLFVWDGDNTRIRKITADGTVSTFAGGGNQLAGFGTNAFISGNYIYGMTIDHNDTIWMVEASGLLHKITSEAEVSVLSLNGVNWPWGLGVDSRNNLYISDYLGLKIFKYDTNGVLTLLAGSGNSGYADGTGAFTAFQSPEALVVDAADNIYVWDAINHVIRKIDQMQNVTTFAGQGSSNVDGSGTNATFGSISAMCFDGSGNMILVDGECVRKVTAATNVTTIAGSFDNTGFTNGPGNLARFAGATGVCISQSTIFVSDSGNRRIRSIMFNPSVEPVSPANLQIGTFPGLKIIGTVGRTYQVQASPDNVQWTTAATLLLTSSPFLWIDQNPVSGNRFYRAFLLP